MRGDNIPALDFDGIATVIFPSSETTEAFINDPDHAKIFKEDPKVYVEQGAVRVSAGEEVVFVNQLASK
jgi:hypothetical protein